MDYSSAKGWPFVEAQKIVQRVEQSSKSHVLFQTGYGPSGLPHIGTFGEVARTSWVRQAFSKISNRPTRLLVFSDDMDALRKVPENVPNEQMLQNYLGMPLTKIPDPFGTHNSFGEHNNAKLCEFLDRFGFEYEFASATDYYTSGKFDQALLLMLAKHQEIVDIIAPTLGAERRASYSPFLPIHPESGEVMQVSMDELNIESGTVTWTDPRSGQQYQTPVTGGACKAQWKADWALRWHALGVDYEMSGKDLIDSVKLSSQICKVLGSSAPINLTYELFLDEQGHKISKSKGNGISIEQWLTYGNPNSLNVFMYANPGSAKRLHKDVIPRAVDDWMSHVQALRENPHNTQNPAWHIHQGCVNGVETSPVTYATLLNIAGMVNTSDPKILWTYLQKYVPHADAESCSLLNDLVVKACAYWADWIAPTRHFRAPTHEEAQALSSLVTMLKSHQLAIEQLPAGSSRETEIQTLVFEAGKRPPFLVKHPKTGEWGAGKAWFQAIYEVLLGCSQGPRFGGTVAALGIDTTCEKINQALAKAENR
jgi:lysyl-tRNA synthetase, class I